MCPHAIDKLLSARGGHEQLPCHPGRKAQPNPLQDLSMASFHDLPTETRILILQHLSSIDLRSFLLSQARHQPTAPPPPLPQRAVLETVDRRSKKKLWSAAVRAPCPPLFRALSRAHLNAELWRTKQPTDRSTTHRQRAGPSGSSPKRSCLARPGQPGCPRARTQQQPPPR